MSLPITATFKINNEDKTAYALKHAAELKKEIVDFLDRRDTIKTGFDIQEASVEIKRKLLGVFSATEDNWQDWRWHLLRRINNTSVLAEIFGLNDKQCEEINLVSAKYRWSISPYYATLFQECDESDPIWLQSVPSVKELADTGYEDPMAEEFTSPSPCITRRYPDRLIINITNQCAMYCRHCQRRRNIGEFDRHQPRHNVLKALEYIRDNEEIRDVLITGGDALMLADSKIDWLLGELDHIKHVEIKRLGTRTIVTLPQRITPELCAVLKKHPPVYINTQFNHPREITPESKRACDMLTESGVVLGNQSVLLKGVNNDPHIVKKLNQELLKTRVRPYYIFQAKPVIGTCHFIAPVEEGIEIMERLRGYTSGLAVPTYIINAPNGLGKIPVSPQYVLGMDSDSIILRTWGNKIIKYIFSHGGETGFPETVGEESV